MNSHQSMSTNYVPNLTKLCHRTPYHNVLPTSIIMHIAPSHGRVVLRCERLSCPSSPNGYSKISYHHHRCKNLRELTLSVMKIVNLRRQARLHTIISLWFRTGILLASLEAEGLTCLFSLQACTPSYVSKRSISCLFDL